MDQQAHAPIPRAAVRFGGSAGSNSKQGNLPHQTSCTTARSEVDQHAEAGYFAVVTDLLSGMRPKRGRSD